LNTEERERAVSALRDAKVVAAPTESFFGLLADATRTDAIDALFRIKPRSAGVGLILPDASAWTSVVSEIPALATRLARSFWPGPLTIVLEAAAGVDSRLTVDGTVAVRVAGPSAAAELALALGRPLTATSANAHGAPPATRSDAVEAAFAEALGGGALMVVPGECPGGAPSTLVRIEKGGFSVVRAGAIADTDIRAACG
jgi:L-threonylcarbamoyladenylate synthase